MSDGDVPFTSMLQLVVVAFLIFKLYLMRSIGRWESKKRMDGKVVVITGANSGIGKQIARDLLRRGAKIIVGCRNLAKARETARELLRETPRGQIIVKYIDCCNLKSVRVFANEILEEETKVDVLINNAGVCGDFSSITGDGFEYIFQINYLAPFLLTELLLPLLGKSAPSRVVNVGSSIYILGRCNLNTLPEDLRDRSRWPTSRYGASKLLLLMYTRALSQELRRTGVTVNVAHPGLARTSITAKRVSINSFLGSLIVLLLGRSAEDAAQTVIKLSVDLITESDNGQYWAECKPEATWKGNDPRVNDRLLEITRRILNLGRWQVSD